MKQTKFAIIALGALGLIGLFMSGILKGFEHDKANVIMVLAGFGVPVAMGALALKAPMERWQAGVALAGFALAAVKLRAWEMVKLIAHLPLGFKFAVLGCLLGVVVSLVALVKPEPRA